MLVELYIRRRKRYILRPGSTICMLSFLLFSIMLDITFSLSMSMLVLFCPWLKKHSATYHFPRPSYQFWKWHMDIVITAEPSKMPLETGKIWIMTGPFIHKQVAKIYQCLYQWPRCHNHLECRIRHLKSSRSGSVMLKFGEIAVRVQRLGVRPTVRHLNTWNMILETIHCLLLHAFNFMVLQSGIEYLIEV